jgi:hypothetical protein
MSVPCGTSGVRTSLSSGLNMHGLERCNDSSSLSLQLRFRLLCLVKGSKLFIRKHGHLLSLLHEVFAELFHFMECPSAFLSRRFLSASHLSTF